jgi:hypothetical protein
MLVRVGACLLLGFGAWFLFTKDRPVDKLWEFSPDGKFKVLMPGIPKERVEKSDRELTARSWIVRETFGEYTVGVIDFPKGVELPQQSLDFLVEKMGDNGARSAGEIVTREEKIVLVGKYPGRHIEAEMPGQEKCAKLRFFFTKSRAYILIAEGPKHWIALPDAMRFLESFQLVGEQ